MVDGIYTLANDVVLNQLIALLNSIEANIGETFPVCIIPYDDRISQVRQEIQSRPYVSLLDNSDIITRWEEFAAKVWGTSPSTLEQWKARGIEGVYRLGMHRRFCAFDEESPFDRFIYLDGDTLALNSIDYLFEKLNEYDLVVYDYQYKAPGHTLKEVPKLWEISSKEEVEAKMFCAGVYTSKKGLFPVEKRSWLLDQLQKGESEVLYSNAPDQTILNYMILRLNIPLYNFARHLPYQKRTGCDATSSHFEQKDWFLYDKGIKLTYLHYIGVPYEVINRVCQGENFAFPYRDLFLHYRYLKDPQNCPVLTGKSQIFNPPPSLWQRAVKKIKSTIKL